MLTLGINQLFFRTVCNYPNFYMLLGPNVATGHTSAIASIECQVHYIVEMIKAMQEYNVQAFQLKKSAEEDYNKWLHKKLDNTVWQGGCQSYYRMNNGKVIAMVSAQFFFHHITTKFN